MKQTGTKLVDVWRGSCSLKKGIQEPMMDQHYRQFYMIILYLILFYVLIYQYL